MKFGKFILLYLLMQVLTSAVSIAETEEPVVITIKQQDPAPGSEAAPSAPIHLLFEDPDSQFVKEKILMEVDRVDVTAFAELKSGSLQYQPTSALAAGSHDVRITGATKDGKQFKEISWSFTVAESKKTSTWDFGFEPSISYEHGFRQVGINPDPNRFSSNIAITEQGAGTFQTSIVSNFQGQDTRNQSGNKFDMANMTATLTAGLSSVSIGDVVPNYDFLSVSNFSRRGFSFTQRLPFLNSGFDVFFVRSDAIFGFEDGLGISDSDQRVDGVSYFFSPFKRADALQLRVYYLRGENAKEQGFNFGGVTRGSKGNAYGFGAGSTHFSGQLHADFFGAWSDFDFNASDGFDGNKDHAALFRLAFNQTPRTLRKLPTNLSFQLELQDLGTFFKSLANPFLVSDRRGISLNGTWNWGILGLTGGASRFHDNVDDIALLPIVDNTAFSGGFSLIPPPKYPSLNFTSQRSEQESRSAVAAFLAVHSIVETEAAVLTYSKTKYNLSLNTSYAINRDLNNRVPDTDSKNVTLGISVLPAPSWNIGPSVGLTRTRDRDRHIDSDLWTYSLTSGIPVVPNALTLDSQISYNKTQSSDFLNRNSNFSGTAQLNLLFGQLLKTKGRQSFAVRASYNRTIVEAPVPLRTKGLEIFGSLDLSWPF